MTPFEARASFAVYPLVDGSRRILGSNYGFADPPVDFPRYAAAPPRRAAARRAAHRPADRARRPRARLRPAAGRRRAAPGRRLRLNPEVSCRRSGPARWRTRPAPRRAPCAGGRRPGSAGAGRGPDRRAAGGSCPAATAASRSCLTAPTMASVTASYGTFFAAARSLSEAPPRSLAPSSAGVMPSAPAAAVRPSLTTPSGGPRPRRAGRRAARSRRRPPCRSVP